MNDKEKHIIKDKYQLVVNNILAEKLCPHLIQKRVINDDDYSVIVSKPAKSAQAAELLQCLFRSPVRGTFEIFLDSLRESGWDYLETEFRSTLSKLEDSGKDDTDLVCSTTNGADDCQCIDDGSALAISEIPQPVSYFCHRENLENKLRKQLEDSGFAILAGIRGAGKTQLARYLIHKMTSHESTCTLGNFGVKMEIYSKSVQNLHSGIEYLKQVLNVNNDKPTCSMEKEVKSGLNTILGHLKKLPTGCNGFHVLLFDDVTIETYCFLTSQLLKASLQHCDSIKVLITTNNSNLYHQDSVIVGGLDKQETLDLFKRGYESVDDDNDILELSEHLSYLPLGIAVAKQIVRKRRQTVRTYLKQLLSPSTSKKLQSKEAQVFLEKEYDKGLMSALTISIGEIKSSLDERIFALYEVTALGSHIRFPLSTLKLLMKWTDDEEDRDFELGNLVEAITDTAMGTVTREGEENYLDTHRAVLLAIRLNWSPNQMRECIGSFLLLMSKVCIKDTRFQGAFRVQMTLLPHAEAVLKHAGNFDRTTVGLQVAEIKLLEAIGYMYTQMSMLDKSQYYLLQARNAFAKYFLGNDTSLFEASDYKLNMKNKAEIILEKLVERSGQCTKDDFLQFVLERTHLKCDREMWRSVLQQKFSVSDAGSLFQSSTLSKEDLSLLQEHQMALSESQIQTLFLAELLITTLFTLGRIYFFRTSKGDCVSEDEALALKSSLQLAHDLCALIHEKYEVPLVHLMLTRHYGLMYLIMEKKGKTNEELLERLLEAKSNYENVLNDSSNYFQGGLLKKIANEDYNIAVCLRQLIRCHVRLLRYDSPQNWPKNKEQGMLYVQRLEDILSRNKSLFHISGFTMNIAKFYAQVALKEKTSREFNMAVELYEDCCNIEYKSGYVKYPWLLALKGLAFLVVQFGVSDKERYAIGLTLKKIEEFRQELLGRSTTFPFEWRKACLLLKKMQSFGGSLSPVSNQSSADFLNSSTDELDAVHPLIPFNEKCCSI